MHFVVVLLHFVGHPHQAFEAPVAAWQSAQQCQIDAALLIEWAGLVSVQEAVDPSSIATWSDPESAADSVPFVAGSSPQEPA